VISQVPTASGVTEPPAVTEHALLVVHGILHLLGMDHATDDQRIEMQARERELLDAHHGPLAADPWV